MCPELSQHLSLNSDTFGARRSSIRLVSKVSLSGGYIVLYIYKNLNKEKFRGKKRSNFIYREIVLGSMVLDKPYRDKSWHTPNKILVAFLLFIII
jgi:hypothetical protein